MLCQVKIVWFLPSSIFLQLKKKCLLLAGIFNMTPNSAGGNY